MHTAQPGTRSIAVKDAVRARKPTTADTKAVATPAPVKLRSKALIEAMNLLVKLVSGLTDQAAEDKAADIVMRAVADIEAASKGTPEQVKAATKERAKRAGSK